MKLVIFLVLVTASLGFDTSALKKYCSGSENTGSDEDCLTCLLLHCSECIIPCADGPNPICVACVVQNCLAICGPPCGISGREVQKYLTERGRNYGTGRGYCRARKRNPGYCVVEKHSCRNYFKAKAYEENNECECVCD